jgi:hypothetical protein
LALAPLPDTTNTSQVWSFSPPADMMYDKGILSTLPPRPLSETGYHPSYSTSDEPMTGLLSHEPSYSHDDIDMSDVGPPAAPPRRSTTFFHYD